MEKARQIVHPGFVVGDVDKRMFGIFLESIREIVYGKMYNPDHPSADDMGFRRDYLELLKELRPTLVRAPGGNLVSGYHWKDGVGPKAQRPARKELAWNQIESNHVGINEWYEYCNRLGAEFMIAANLGTGTPEEAAEEVDYCNTESGTALSDLRRSHGYEKPHNLKLWCLGNEMDGFWQIGRRTPLEYARICEETAKMVKWMDPSIECVACGTCTNEPFMETYGEWDRIVLEHCYDHVEYLSIHRYYSYDLNREAFSPNPHSVEDLACVALDLNDYIDTILAAADLVKGRKRAQKQIHLSFDEYGVIHTSGADLDTSAFDWKELPTGNREGSNLLDALLMGSYLVNFLNRCDRIKIACQSIAIGGLVNGSSDGNAYRQTSFYPFRDVSYYGRGRVLRQNLQSPQVHTPLCGEVNAIQSAAVLDEQEGVLTVFALNMNLREDIAFAPDFSAFTEATLTQHFQLYDEEPLAENTEENPERIVEKEVALPAGSADVVLPKHSWNVLRYRVRI